jgi:hypothetical protein
VGVEGELANSRRSTTPFMAWEQNFSFLPGKIVSVTTLPFL